MRIRLRSILPCSGWVAVLFHVRNCFTCSRCTIPRASFSPKLPPFRKFTSIVAATMPCDASSEHRNRKPAVEFNRGSELRGANTRGGKGPRPRGMQTCPLSGTLVFGKGHGAPMPRLANTEMLIRGVTHAGPGVAYIVCLDNPVTPPELL